LAVRKINGRFVVEFEQSKTRVFRRLPVAATKAQALALETRIRQSLIDQKILGKVPDVSLEYAIKAWLEEEVRGRKSEGATKSHAAAVLGLLGGGHLSASAVVGETIRAQSSLSAGTRNRRLCILKAVAKFAWRKGWTQENLSAKIQLLPEKNARHVYLTREQMDALIDAIEPFEAKAFVAIAAFTGMRQGEVMALTPEDVGESGLIIRDSKIGEPRIVPYLGDRRYLKAIPFKSHKRTLYAAFERARDELGLGGIRYHDLRHSAASALVNSGADIFVVGQILGHKSAQTTKRYAHLSVERMHAALKAAYGDGSEGRKKGGLPKQAGGKGAAKATLRRVAGKAGIKGKAGGKHQGLPAAQPTQEARARRRGSGR